MNKLYIVRHGQTDWNKKMLYQGSVDIELNDKGKSQANELKNNLDISTIDFCVCSPLKRAKQTAKIITDDKIPIIYDNLLVERNYGDYEGKPVEFDLIKEHWDCNLNSTKGNVESVKDCLKRARDFLNKIKENYDYENILIVSHGSFIKCLHFNLIGYDEQTDFLSFKPENAKIYEYKL